MKILFIHNFYQTSSPSGEDAVFISEVELLRRRGHTVVIYEKHNDDISEDSNGLKIAINTIWSKESYREITELIKKENPDIAHVHNIWYLISPSAYYACKDAGVPVVQTLHNFRMFCVNGLLMRNGKVCEECVSRLPLKGILHGCYRNSRLYSLPVALSEIYHKLRKTWTEQVDAYIALTEFGKKKFIQCGLPEKKIFVKPNFLTDPLNLSTSPQQYAVFIGRLSKEKGVNVLIDALKHLNTSTPQHLNTFSLKLIGDGPMRQKMETEVKSQGLEQTVEFLGKRTHAECMELLKSSRFLILPSVCYENFPMAIVEAFACGKPVIASRLGAMAYLVNHGRTGLLFELDNPQDLAEKITWMMENEAACMEMGKNARTEFENKYTADRNFDTLMDIYRKTISIIRN